MGELRHLGNILRVTKCNWANRPNVLEWRVEEGNEGLLQQDVLD